MPVGSELLELVELLARPRNLIGMPVTALTESAAPPRASPSSFVSTTPSKRDPLGERLRDRRPRPGPSCASRTSRTFVGFVALRTRASSSISVVVDRGAGPRCRRSRRRGPGRAPARARARATADGSFAVAARVDRDRRSARRAARAGRSRRGAGGRRRRAAGGFRSCGGGARAWPATVVLPEPWRPTSRITVGGRPANASFEPPAPIARSAPRGRLHDLLARV